MEILSGVFEGSTMGTPVSLLIRNEEKESSDYEPLKDVFRPGGADPPTGPSSGRVTGAAEAAHRAGSRHPRGRGGDRKEGPCDPGHHDLGYSLEIGGVRAMRVDPAEIERNPARAPDAEAAARMIKVIEAARVAGDSVGGIAEVVASGSRRAGGTGLRQAGGPPRTRHHVSRGRPRRGSGDRVRRVRDARIAYNDEAYVQEGRMLTRTNDTGGITGGISTGGDIVVRAAIRPPASISLPQKAVDAQGTATTIQIGGRRDPCIVPRAIPVLEAMTALVLADCVLVQEAYRQDT